MSRPTPFPRFAPEPTWTLRRPTRLGQPPPQRPFPPSMRAFASPLRRLTLAKRESHVFRRPNVRSSTVDLKHRDPQTTTRCVYTPAAAHHGVNQIVNTSLTL